MGWSVTLHQAGKAYQGQALSIKLQRKEDYDVRSLSKRGAPETYSSLVSFSLTQIIILTWKALQEKIL
jgi:hypothetical protein